MYKRLLIITSIFVVLIIVFLIFLRGSKDANEGINPAQAVSSQAIIYAENIDFEYFESEFFRHNLVWNSFLTSEFEFYPKELLTIYSQLLKRFLDLDKGNSRVFSASFHGMGNHQVEPVAYLEGTYHLSKEQITEIFRGLVVDKIHVRERNYDGVPIWEVSFAHLDETDKIAFGVTGGLLIISSSSILLEESIRTIHAVSGFYHTEEYKQLSATAGKYVQANIYVNFEKLPRIFQSFFQDMKGNTFGGWGSFGDFGEYDVDIDDERILLNGISISSDTTEGWLNVFNGQESVKTEIISIIPSDVSEFKIFGISNEELFSERLSKQHEFMGKMNIINSQHQNAAELIGASPIREMLKLCDNEIAIFSIDANGEGNFEKVVAVEIRSRSEALSNIKMWIANLAKRSGGKAEDYLRNYQLDAESEFDIYTFPDDLYKDEWLKKYFKNKLCFYNNYMLMSNSMDALQKSLYFNILGKTLINEPEFREINNYMSTRSNITVYKNPTNYYFEMHDQLNSKLTQESEKIIGLLSKVPGFIYQFSSEGKFFYSNVALRYFTGYRENNMAVWESLLDSVLSMKPAIVENHNTGENEIFVQDASNTAYLLNNTGRILWKKKLEGPVLSEIIQVDYYSNGKLQYLFNTNKAIHLIDRNGNYVERYPVKLASDATNGLALFDYDKTKDYRIFIATEDQQILVYNIEGNVVTGWNFNKTEGRVNHPVQHFRVKEKDYLVFADNIRVYILNRRGQERVSLNKQVEVSENNQFNLDMDIKNDRPKIITTDSKGHIIGIDFHGRLDTLGTFNMPPDHFFIYKDLDHDGNSEYIFTEKNEIKAYESNGKRLFSFKIKNDISTLPDIYQFSASDIKIGIADTRENKIYLLNSDGTLYQGFPLEGQGRFSIGYFAGSDSRFNLIVGNNDGFLYNYSVN